MNRPLRLAECFVVFRGWTWVYCGMFCGHFVGVRGYIAECFVGISWVYVCILQFVRSVVADRQQP